MLVATFIAWGPILLPYFPSKWASVPPNPSAQTSAPAGAQAPQTHELIWGQALDLATAFEIAKLQFIGEFSGLPPQRGGYPADCKVLVTSTDNNVSFRTLVESAAQHMQCQPQAQIPPDKTNADVTPTPTPTAHPYIVVRAIAAPEGVALGPTGQPPTEQIIEYRRDTAIDLAAEGLRQAFANLGLDARRSKILEANEDKTVIYIELGNHAPWNK